MLVTELTNLTELNFCISFADNTNLITSLTIVVKGLSLHIQLAYRTQIINKQAIRRTCTVPLRKPHNPAQLHAIRGNTK